MGPSCFPSRWAAGLAVLSLSNAVADSSLTSVSPTAIPLRSSTVTVKGKELRAAELALAGAPSTLESSVIVDDETVRCTLVPKRDGVIGVIIKGGSGAIRGWGRYGDLSVGLRFPEAWNALVDMYLDLDAIPSETLDLPEDVRDRIRHECGQVQNLLAGNLVDARSLVPEFDRYELGPKPDPIRRLPRKLILDRKSAATRK